MLCVLLYVATCQMHCVLSFFIWHSVIVIVTKFCCPFRREEQTFFRNIKNFSACQRGVCPEYSVRCLSIGTDLNVIYFSVSTPISNKQTRTEVMFPVNSRHMLFNVKLSALGFCCKFSFLLQIT
jgi:hypothetical protein